VTHDGYAVASDPERDLVWVADLQTGRVASWLTLNVGDEPGRLVEDSNGNVHVALRRGGALVTFDPRAAKPTVQARRDVCAEPRGVSLDTQTSSVIVACTGGELVWMPVDGSAATTRLKLPYDLRDVVPRGDKLQVTSFRSAKLMTIDRAGTMQADVAMPTSVNSMGNVAASVAWRTIPIANGSTLIVHNRSKIDAVNLTTTTDPSFTTTSAPYGSTDGFSCPQSIVDSAVTVVGADGVMTQAQLSSGSLPIDVTVDAMGYQIAVVTASPGKVSMFYAANVHPEQNNGQCAPIDRPVIEGGEPIAAAWWGSTLVAQTRNPVGLSLSNGTIIAFPVKARVDRGFSLFHQQAGAPLACASCHAEGREDGRVWQFNPDGQRRTQAINGGLLRTAPFHWDGSLSDIGSLMNEVFVHRMGGHTLTGDDVTALSGWLDNLPAAKPSTTVDATAAARGKVLFESSETGCTSCHSGARFTNNSTVDVGTGMPVQVPSLTGVSARGPWLHNGCATTLRDRFTPSCGGGDLHGHTSQLSAAQIDDLVSYLQTL
jgi:mono/diheme cytochrome c family protein